MFTEDEGIVMALHRAKQNKDEYLSSSMHISPSVMEEDKKKRPDAVLCCNSTKEGVDTADEMLRCCSAKAASRGWPLATFFNLLDIVALDIFIIAKDLA